MNTPTEAAPVAMRVEILKHLGWTQHREYGGSGAYVAHYTKGKETLEWNELPELTLDWLHEVEKTLTREQHWQYIGHLVELVEAEWTDGYEEVFKVAHATALDRATAFLATIKGL